LSALFAYLICQFCCSVLFVIHTIVSALPVWAARSFCSLRGSHYQ
jgi:hypothetical protein